MSLLKSLLRVGAMAPHVTRGIYPAVATQVICKRWHRPVRRKYDWFYREPGEDLDQVPMLHYTAGWDSTEDKLRKGVWPWTYGVRSRFPEHYKKRYMELFQVEPRPVHYRPDTHKWSIDEYGVRTRVQNVPIPIIFPAQADEGLWGGEGLVQGWRKRKDNPKKPKTPRVWKPSLVRRVFYSEILDKHMDITVTLRTLDLVDEAYGFDFYILKTHQVDLASKLGMALKRNMISALINKDFHQDRPARRDEVYNKYKQFIIPAEEVPWLGLSLEEADDKQRGIEEAEAAASIQPLKHLYAQDLLTRLNDPEEAAALTGESSSSGWLSKLNPFRETESKS